MKRILFFLVIGLLIGSCTKDPVDSGEFEIPTFPVQAKVMGVVEDQYGNTLEGAIIQISFNQEETMSNGYFFFDRQSLNAKGTLVKASLTGYFDSYKMINPVQDVTSLVVFNLIRKGQNGSFNASDGREINLTSGASITFSPNSIVDGNGQVYNGSVSVFAHYIDPSDLPNVEESISGDMRSVDSDYNLGQVVPIGIIEVELESPSGAPLSLGLGSTAVLKYPTQSAANTEYPDELTLFNFNESTGFLEESGIANFESGKYVAEVAHFSQWFVCYPASKVELGLRILTTGGAPFQGGASLSSNTGYCTMPDPGTTQCIYWTCIPARPNSNGDIWGGVPMGVEFQLRIWDGDGCGNSNVIYSQPIGPFSSDASEVVTVSPSDYSQSYKEVQVTGNFLNCNSQPVENGLMKVDGRYYALSFDGSFNLSFFVCDSKADIEIEAFDFDAGKTYGVEIIAIPDPDLNVINLNDTEICIVLDEYIIVENSICNNTFVLVDFDQSYILGDSQDFSTFIIIWFGDPNDPNSPINITQTGTYPIQNESSSDCGGGILFWEMGSEITVTSFPQAVGDYLEGTFSGSLDGIATTGSFRIRNN
ncbi:MAG: hypothetical protein ACJATI_001047 [Halioglobus sp.]|jgi:hypothetical protein